MDRGNPDSASQAGVGNQGQQEQGTGQNFVRPAETTSETTPQVPPTPHMEPKVETPKEINQELDPSKTPEAATPAVDDNQPTTLTPPPPASITNESQIIQPQPQINQDYHMKTVQPVATSTPEFLAKHLPKEPNAQNASQTVEALKKLKASNDQSLKRAA